MVVLSSIQVVVLCLMKDHRYKISVAVSGFVYKTLKNSIVERVNTSLPIAEHSFLPIIDAFLCLVGAMWVPSRMDEAML